MNNDTCICPLDESKKFIKKNILDTSIYDKEIIPKKIVQKDIVKDKRVEQSKKKPKALVSKCSGNIQPFKLDNLEVKKVLVEYRVKEEKRDFCDILKLSGYNINWRKKDIHKMLNTPDGRIMLNKVDNEIKKLSGLKIIKEEDIIRCNPNYLS